MFKGVPYINAAYMKINYHVILLLSVFSYNISKKSVSIGLVLRLSWIGFGLVPLLNKYTYFDICMKQDYSTVIRCCI